MTRRLILGFLAFAAVVLALLVIPLGVVNQRSERADLTRGIERDAVAAASLATDLLEAGDAATAAARTQLEALLEEYAESSDARVVVVDARGVSVIDTGEPGRDVELGRDFTTRPEVAAALEGRVDSGERGSDTLGHPLLYVAVPVTSGGEPLGAVRISYPAAELDSRIDAYWTALAAVGLAVLAIAALAGVFLAQWIASPLDDIVGVAHGIGSGDLHARADTEVGPPEVRAVAAGLNASIEALERMLEDQRSFTADASHQLRTPLHAMTLRLDNAAYALEQGDPAAAAGDVKHAARDVERLAGLVESLLVLERADREAAGQVEPLDLASVVAGRMEEWRERATRSDVRVEVDVPAPLLALARAVHVEQVLDNYVDNAIAVSPAGRAVRVVGRRDGSAVELHVVDEGPGMGDEELELAFRRFHSGAERPARRTSGGFGLGLAIVRRLAEVDGGSAWLRHGPGRGIDAVVRYRAADEREVLPARTAAQ